ncbi:MAG TPA: hypothetical protein VG346_07790 [Acidimicrobiales bacterium]|nr:hypothetical protein [Acidimicrobiales bacterium]
MVPLSLAGTAGVASATTPGPATCGASGDTSPTSLPGGSYTTVTVAGICFIDSGQVVTSGDVTVEPGASLIAAFATDGGSGTSGISVGGNINVDTGTLVLGCENPEFTCEDNASLNSADTVQGSIEAPNALGVLVHNSTIDGDVVETGGGGGDNCIPTPAFLFGGPPVYSDYEDNTIGGNLRVTGLTTCWFGAIRNQIGGSATFANGTFADPDASENLTNTIAGNLLCSGNSPVVEYGDSTGSANVVSGFGAGECAFGVTQPNPAPSGPPAPISVPSTALHGYWLAAADGGVFSFGVPFLGSQSGTTLSKPIAGMAAIPGGGGYNLAEGNGMVFADGARATDCSNVSGPLNQSIVGIAAAPGGNGCWLAGSGGEVFPMGSNAPFFGSAGGLSLSKPVVGIAAAPNNDGYDLAASDGGVFNYGTGTAFYGSMGGQPLNQPVVGMALDPATGGYWLVAKDGGIFAFNAPFLGSMGGTPLNKPIVGMAAAPTGDGYYLVASDGGIFAFGTGAHFQGSTGNLTLNKPVVGMSLG